VLEAIGVTLQFVQYHYYQVKTAAQALKIWAQDVIRGS